MAYIFLGLGNPGEEYKNTRHNTGRIILELFAKEFGFSEFVFDKKINALRSEGKIGKEKVLMLFPETFMNNSGKTVKALDLSVKQAEKLLVVYDDLDLPFLNTKLSYNKSSGGHRGLESIIKAIKTEKFYRLRFGISPITPSGKMKKPKGEEAVGKLIMKPFSSDELKEIKKISKKTNVGLELFIKEGYEKSASYLN